MSLWTRSARLTKSGRRLSLDFSRSMTVRGVSMPDIDFQPEPFTGKSYEEAIEITKKHLLPTHSQKILYYSKPLYLHQGHMQYLYDVDGKRYLDMFAGIATVGVGHSHPKVVNAVTEQIKKLSHSSILYMNSKKLEYVEKLASKLPGDLKVIFPTSSGAEANDLAMAMMRTYTGKWDIISHRNAYHGVSPTTLGLTNVGQYKFSYPHGFGTHSSINPDVYKGKHGGKNCRDSPVQADRPCNCMEGQCEAEDHYVDHLQDLLDNSVPQRIAGFFAEPIQGVNGTVQYPKGYLKKAFERIRARGGLCVSDEVQTGFGRLGSHYWGFEAAGVIPDIVTCAKTIANGLPFAAVITTPEIANAMMEALPFSTYSGNPVVSAAASAVLDVIDEEKLQENCANVGTYCLKELSKLRDDYSIVGDVRGKGLMIGVEFVLDKQPTVPLSPERLMDLANRTKEYGVLFGRGGRYANTFRIKPPMCVTKEDVDYAVAVLRQSIEEHMEKFN